jgi:hypothetical protein
MLCGNGCPRPFPKSTLFYSKMCKFHDLSGCFLAVHISNILHSVVIYIYPPNIKRRLGEAVQGLGFRVEDNWKFRVWFPA